MTDIDRLILEAWQKLGPKILADPDELHKRLARRRKPIMTRPPRAWCLALRASDRRINPAHWVISPEHAMDLNHPAHPYEPIEHQVTIRPHALRKYCRPVRTDSWGEEVADVARALGVSEPHLLRARRTGLFSQRYIKGLGGKRGKPIPLIHSWTTLDPSGHGFARPDPLWGGLWEFLPDMIPDDFEQTLIRKPCYKPYATTDTPKGYDDFRLRGWRWVCPACKKLVSKIYYPLPPQTLFDFLGCDPAVNRGRVGPAPKKFLRDDLHKMDPPPPTFACHRCHRVMCMHRTTDEGWNHVVTHLTRGMLYGHEVEKPKWYKKERKRARSRILHGRPAIKREAVFNRIKLGWTVQQIAREMLISRVAVEQAVRHICKQERVKNRHELAAKFGWIHPQPINGQEKFLALAKQREDQILPLLLQNLSRKEICQSLGLPFHLVRDAVIRIYRKHKIPKGQGRRGLAEKLGVELKKVEQIKIVKAR